MPPRRPPGPLEFLVLHFQFDLMHLQFVDQARASASATPLTGVGFVLPAQASLEPLGDGGPWCVSHIGMVKWKRGALAGLRFHPDSPAVAIHDSLADRQADARARVLRAGVQAFEDQKDAIQRLGGNADAVVAHGEQPMVFVPRGVHVDLRRLLAAELHRVAEEVLEQLHELRAVGPDGGQFAVGDFGRRLLDAAC